VSVPATVSGSICVRVCVCISVRVCVCAFKCGALGCPELQRLQIEKKRKTAREKGPKENCAIVAKIEGLAAGRRRCEAAGGR